MPAIISVQRADFVLILSEKLKLLSDRIRLFLMHTGRITGDVVPSRTSKKEIMTLATGLTGVSE